MPFGMVEDPIDLAERTIVAKKCIDELDLPMPALVDRLDDKVNRAYKGWPDRLYLVGTDGRLAYTGGRGPFFFSPGAWEAAIKGVLGADAKPGHGAAATKDGAGRR